MDFPHSTKIGRGLLRPGMLGAGDAARNREKFPSDGDFPVSASE